MNINRFRMTASEIAMGRYMRAPDHSATDFDTAFADFASPDADKKLDAAAAGASGDGGAAASGGAGDGQGASGDSGGGSGGADGGAGDSGAGDGSGGAAAGGDGAAAGAGAGEGAGAAAGGDGAGDGAAAGGAGGDAGPAGAADSADAAAAAAAAAGSDSGAQGADQAGAAAGGAATADADAILAGLKKLVGQGDAPAAGGESAAAGGGAAGDTPAPIYNDEETAFLKKYDEDWGDVVKGEALKRRAEYQALLSHIFSQVQQFVKPIQETAEVLAERTFSTDLRSAVPDYSNQLRDEVTTWVKSQPTYLQVAYNHVITEGTVDEIKDLVDRYRTATGKVAPKPAGAGGAAPKPAGSGNELSDEAKKAAAALAPVDSKRSGVSAPSDPSNFDDAWKQASADLG